MVSKPIPPILARIVAQKHREIAEIRLQKTPEACQKSLVRSLQAKPRSILAECKKKSPSAGIIRIDYDPVAIAQVYQKLAVAGISVLTDRHFFGGCLADLTAVVKSVDLPVLRKDFIIDKKQIDEARLAGAHAILLIVRILTPEQLDDLHQHARQLGMDVLVETHSQQEIQVALDTGIQLLGINSRDLDTFAIHMDLITELAATLPAGIHKIAESGVTSRQDYLKMTDTCESILIGSYFMRAQNIERAFDQLLND